MSLIVLLCAQRTFLLPCIRISVVFVVAEAQTERGLPGEGPWCSLGLEPAECSALSISPGRSTAAWTYSRQCIWRGMIARCTLQSLNLWQVPQGQL